MIEIGKVNIFIVKRETKSGFYLKPMQSEEEVFLPPAMAPIGTKVGDEIEAFVYPDTKGGLIATSEIPYAAVGEYALMRAVDTPEFGAFFDWGIEKDLLVPGNQQKNKVKLHEEHLIRVCIEENTNRIYGTTKLGKYIQESDFDIESGEEIKIQPVEQSELGYRVIINRKFIGMIYTNEIFSPVKIGELYDGVVKKIRDDGLVDAALQAQGIKNLLDAKEIVLQYLKENGGKSDLHDKSAPDKIKAVLGMSKQSFKKAIGMLYKERLIKINKDGIVLLS